MRTFSRFPVENTTLPLFNRHRTSTPANRHDPTDTYLRWMREKLDSISDYAPPAFEQPQPQKYVEGTWDTNPEYDEWWGARDWYERGMTRPDESDIAWEIEQTISQQGLDVILEMRPLPDGDDWFLDGRSTVWSSDEWNLFMIKTNPGPLFINFIASRYRIDPTTHYHISIVYRNELLEWYNHLEQTRGEDYAVRMLRRWFGTYRIIQSRYNGKHARLMGHLTRGRTLQLNDQTHVDGVGSERFKLWDGDGGDPDMQFLHRLPGNDFPVGSSSHKSKQDFHVSLLLSRVADPDD